MYKPNKVNPQAKQLAQEKQQETVQAVNDVREEQQFDTETFDMSNDIGFNKVLKNFDKLKDYIKGCDKKMWIWLISIVVVIGLAVFAIIRLAVITGITNTDNRDNENTEETIETTTTAETMSDEDFFNLLANGDYESEADEELFSYMKIDRQSVFANKNAVGWLKINGTNVDYSVVQTNDNAYYLDKDADGTESESGAIYGDYRNDFNQLDRNNVIYGHNMASGTMFGTLSRMLDDSFYADNDGYIYFDSQYFNNIFEVYSVYEIDLQSFCYIQTGFKGENEFADFVAKTQELNVVTALKDKTVPEDTYLLTLSTCIEGGTKRLVVHGYLYAREIN